MIIQNRHFFAIDAYCRKVLVSGLGHRTSSVGLLKSPFLQRGVPLTPLGSLSRFLFSGEVDALVNSSRGTKRSPSFSSGRYFLSIRVMADVWDFGPDDPVTLSVLLCLASHCNDEGVSCHPSISRVARMVRRSERTVERSISDLETEDWIAVSRGVGRGKVSQYSVNVTKLKRRQRDAFIEEEKATATTIKGDSLSLKGDSDDIAIRKNSHETSFSLEPAEPKIKTPKNGTQIPADFKVTSAHQTWASSHNLPNPTDHVDAFIDHWKARGLPMKDWDAAFRTWMRNSVRFNKGSNGNGNGSNAGTKQLRHPVTGELYSVAVAR